MTMNQKAKAGDLVSRRKAIVFQHWGVMLDERNVLHNSPAHGEHVTSIEEFAAGHEIVVHPVAPEQRPWVIENACKVLSNPKAYDIFSNNCEHTANRIISGQAYSPQLRLVLAILAIGLLIRANKA